MCAKEAVVRVQLIDDDEAQGAKEATPIVLVGQDRLVQHVRVRENDVCPACEMGPAVSISSERALCLACSPISDVET